MSKTVEEQYPELLHYTTAAGLNGILRSGSLWASHATFLNDAEEITHFFDVRLPQIVYEVALACAQELAKSPAISEKIQAQGGIEKLAKSDSDAMANVLIKGTLEFNNPYIFSMSAPTEGSISQSGLLSQWRGYGTDGGYAFVFDTNQFMKLFFLENKTYRDMFMICGDVYYHGIESDSQPAAEDVRKSEAILREGVAKLFRGGATEDTPEFYQAISQLSCLYKHRGFWEEREVRVVALPSVPETAENAALEYDAKPCKPVKTFIRNGMPVPYLDLFANLPNHPAQLPIKRIIVGPHRDKALRAEAVRRLLREIGYKDVEVACSKIPYIGR